MAGLFAFFRSRKRRKLAREPMPQGTSGQGPSSASQPEQALNAHLTAVGEPWTAHAEDSSGLARYPLVLPLIAWGYYEDHRRWLDACDVWADAKLPVANPPSVLKWNSDKTYLGRLAEGGVPIPPTRYVESATEAEVEAAFDAFGADTLIVKPTVSGGAFRTVRLSRGQPLVDAPDGAAMIQPYLPTIESEGELSLLFFGGRFSHAVRKRPKAGEFRIQVQFGGAYIPEPAPPPEALALAEQVLAAVEEPLLYARIDVIRDEEGRWLLMEAELIEPDFYLGSAPDRGAAFARAVRERLDGVEPRA